MYKVLIIEDDEATCKRLKREVKKEGFDVITAYDGEEGVKAFRENNIDIVISDYSLPKKTGLEIMRTVLSERPETAFIMITGHGSQDIAVEAINDGALDYIKKPIDLDHLFIALGRYKERKKFKEKYSPLPAVLVVEDDEISRKFFVRELKKENYFVIEAKDGLEGLNFVKQNKIDLVITDLKMPNLPGIPFIKEIRKLSDDQEIIIVTGYGEENETIEALRYGAYAYLKKPFNVEELLVIVEKAIEKLTLKRSLLYRNRDYALIQEVIGSISKDKRITIDLRDENTKQPALIFAKQLIDELLLYLVIFDKEFNIVFQNKSCSSKLGDSFTIINDEWISKLGIKDYTFENFQKSAAKIFDADNTIINYQQIDQSANVLFTRITALTNSGIIIWCIALFRCEHS